LQGGFGGLTASLQRKSRQHPKWFSASPKKLKKKRRPAGPPLKPSIPGGFPRPKKSLTNAQDQTRLHAILQNL
jgi:hypothetical protein